MDEYTKEIILLNLDILRLRIDRALIKMSNPDIHDLIDEVRSIVSEQTLIQQGNVSND